LCLARFLEVLFDDKIEGDSDDDDDDDDKKKVSLFLSLINYFLVWQESKSIEAFLVVFLLSFFLYLGQFSLIFSPFFSLFFDSPFSFSLLFAEMSFPFSYFSLYIILLVDKQISLN
jgi:hypothetical protein